LGEQQRRDSKQRGGNAGADERDHRKTPPKAQFRPREHDPKSPAATWPQAVSGFLAGRRLPDRAARIGSANRVEVVTDGWAFELNFSTCRRRLAQRRTRGILRLHRMPGVLRPHCILGILK
jgi:hypothetical protein